MPIEHTQFRSLVDRVLDAVGLGGEDARELLLLTAAHESHLGTYIRQVRGPALGVYQMEPATHDDIWRNFLAHRPALAKEAHLLAGYDRLLQLEADLAYQTLMARIHYLRIPAPLPWSGDVWAMAEYWKQWWNTPLGRGRPDQAVASYLQLTKGEKR